jgi:hypothetical protein
MLSTGPLMGLKSSVGLGSAFGCGCSHLRGKNTITNNRIRIRIRKRIINRFWGEKNLTMQSYKRFLNIQAFWQK